MTEEQVLIDHIQEYLDSGMWQYEACYLSKSDLEVIIKTLEQTRWIPVSERLPEEKINPITEDFYEYQCTYHAYGIYDVRSYKFGNGHWWHGPGIMDDSVIAWRPLPEPYKIEGEGKG